MVADFRAKYRDSWATLKLINAAPLYPIAKALGWEIKSIDNDSLDKEFESNTLGYREITGPARSLTNRPLTLVISRNKRLKDEVIRSIQAVLPASVDDWELRKNFEKILSNLFEFLFS